MKRTQKLLCMGLFSKKLSGPLLTGQPGGVRRYPGFAPPTCWKILFAVLVLPAKLGSDGEITLLEDLLADGPALRWNVAWCTFPIHSQTDYDWGVNYRSEKKWTLPSADSVQPLPTSRSLRITPLSRST